MNFFENFKEQFIINFIDDNRWQYILSGLGYTLLITLGAIILGILLGCLCAIVRTTHDKTGKMKVLNAICQVYLTVIRGTPTMIQLLIIYFVIFGSVNVPKVLVAILSFGINSGAYVAEIFRGGIMSIDNGQMEAGRSLGLNYRQTMINIIIPQAIKASLPALCNEFIVLLKETSIGVYISLPDLTYAGNLIRSQTYSAFMPLIAVALIYLALVMGLTAVFNKFERWLRKSDH